MKVQISQMLILAFVILISTPAMSAEKFIFYLDKNQFSDNERVVGFELRIVAGKIDSFLSIPIGWSIDIDNDPSWKTKIVGSSVVGAAALRPDSLNNIIRIEKREFMDLEFNVKIDVIVTEDFEKERTVHLKMNDLVLRKESE